MNVQRLIEKIGNLDKLYGEKFYVALDDVLDLVKQLDEPEKVVVPQFVADWIEVCKEHLTTSLYTAMNPNFMKENNQSFDLILWIKKTSNQEIFARAWIFGYEVEKEKRYLVKIKGVNEECECLVFGELSNTWKLRSIGSFGELKKHHTRKELEEANFGWVFDCEGVEIEEVE